MKILILLALLFVACEKENVIPDPTLSATSPTVIELNYTGPYQAVFVEYYVNGWCPISRTHTTEKKQRHSWQVKTGERYRGVVVVNDIGIPTNEIKL